MEVTVHESFVVGLGATVTAHYASLLIQRILLSGSFKIVTLAPKTKGDDSTVHGNIKEWGHTNKSKSTNEHTKRKPRLNTQKNIRPNRAV